MKTNEAASNVMFKDPVIRRFISSSMLAGTFVWVAIYFFDVDPEVIWVLLGFCFVFVLGLIVVGLVLAPLVRLVRRKPPLLARLADIEAGVDKDSQQKDDPDSKA